MDLARRRFHTSCSRFSSFIDAAHLTVNSRPRQMGSLVERYYPIWCRTGVLAWNLCVLCIAGGHACCYIYMPEDQTDAEQQMMRGR